MKDEIVEQSERFVAELDAKSKAEPIENYRAISAGIIARIKELEEENAELKATIRKLKAAPPKRTLGSRVKRR